MYTKGKNKLISRFHQKTITQKVSSGEIEGKLAVIDVKKRKGLYQL